MPQVHVHGNGGSHTHHHSDHHYPHNGYGSYHGHHNHYGHHGHHHTHYTPGYYTHGGSSFIRGVNPGVGLVAVGIALIATFIIVPSILSSFAVTGFAGSAGISAVFTAATLGFGALALYASVGLAYLYSGAKEAYQTDKGVAEILKSRINNEQGLSVKGIVSAIGAVLWSPFLLLGTASGKAVKAIVTACSSKNNDAEEHIPLEDFSMNGVYANPLFTPGNGTSSEYTEDCDMSPPYNGKSKPFFSSCCFGQQKTEKEEHSFQIS